jgi:hypothetical protein
MITLVKDAGANRDVRAAYAARNEELLSLGVNCTFVYLSRYATGRACHKNPYCIRHSAITADSDYLPEYALKKKRIKGL